jgi:hypothetical protein
VYHHSEETPNCNAKKSARLRVCKTVAPQVRPLGRCRRRRGSGRFEPESDPSNQESTSIFTKTLNAARKGSPRERSKPLCLEPHLPSNYQQPRTQLHKDPRIQLTNTDFHRLKRVNANQSEKTRSRAPKTRQPLTSRK